MENKHTHWQRFWAQVAMQLIRWYAGSDPYPDWWTGTHSWQVESWLVYSDAYKRMRVTQ